ncbi:AfsR/SARP family transcriptional regulator [Jiangella endophytica]|uniref:AfsR/SARP family transcriptional regulator n=1 Tax=Jiangella endophytica TaxID=1623398 RepID=UPI0018E4FC46|nr:BTAD domain-containing putative transcriptional regulator [Jiangella endophytica]
MQIRLLGPVDVLDGDAAVVEVGTAKQRLVLAALAVAPGRPLPFDLLVDRVWSDDPPAGARAALYSYVARLRRIVAPAAIVHEHGGYTLRIDPEAVDVIRWRKLLERARELADAEPEAAADLFRRSERLWRDPVLAGLTGDWARRTRRRLSQQRSEALTELALIELARGRHVELLEDIGAWVEQYPLAERLIAVQLRTLMRAGRRDEAVDAYTRTRERFAEAVGGEPGPGLRRLHERIQRHDPTLDADEPAAAVLRAAVQAVPRQLPRSASTFVGRDAEQRMVHDAIVAGSGGAAVGVAAIYGPGGIGKSTLALQVARAAADRFPGGQLYVDVRSGADQAAPPRTLEVLGRFLRALGVPAPEVPADPDEAAARYRSVTARRRLLVVVDNAGDAEQVRPLLPAGAGSAVLITSRSPLAALDDAAHVRLDLLPAEAAGELLTRLDRTGRCVREAVATRKLAELCGRLPLALRILSARIAAVPSWPLSAFVERLADQTRRLDQLGHADRSVRACFDLSYLALTGSQDPDDGRAARAFRLLALPDGADIAADVAARLLDVAVADSEAVLARLRDAQLLQSPVPGRYRMHDLVRDYAREVAGRDEPSGERGAALDRAWTFLVATAQQAVATVNQAWADIDLPAEHALPFDDRGTALAWLNDETESLVAAAAQAVATGSRLAVPLVLSVVRPLQLRSDTGRLEELCTEAAELAAAQADDAALGRLHFGAALAAAGESRFAVSAEHLGQALELFERTADGRRLNVLISLGRCEAQLGRYPASIERLREGAELARRLGDVAAEAAALQTRSDVEVALGRDDEALASATRALDLDRAQRNRHAEAVCLNAIGDIHLARGEAAQATERYREALDIFREFADPMGIGIALANLGLAAVGTASLDLALRHFEDALETLDQTNERYARCIALAEASGALRRLGRLPEAVDHASRALALGRAARPVDEARAMWRLGEALRDSGDRRRGMWFLHEAHRRFSELGTREADDVRRVIDADDATTA